MLGRWRLLAGLTVASYRLVFGYVRYQRNNPEEVQDAGDSPLAEEILDSAAGELRPAYLPLLLWGGYLAAMVAGEMAVGQRPWVGMILYANVLIFLLAHASLTSSRERALALALTVVPLTRILGMLVPSSQLSVTAWYLVTSLPIFVVGLAIAGGLGISRSALGVRRANLPLQLGIGLLGLPIGLAAYLALKPAPLIPGISWHEVWLPALVLFLSTGLVEEFIFRGVIQAPALSLLGRWGLIYGSLLFAILHVGNLPGASSVPLFAIGLLFAWLVVRTGSLLGVSVAHGLANVGLYLAIPLLAVQAPFASPQAQLPAAVTMETGQTQSVLGATPEAAPSPPSLPGMARSVPGFLSQWPQEGSPASVRPGRAALTSTPTATATPPATVPPSPTPVPARETERYMVQPGDSLFLISLRYGTTVDVIMALNGLEDRSFVRSGQVLLVPKTSGGGRLAATASQSATPTPATTARPVTVTPLPAATSTAAATPTTRPQASPQPAEGWERYVVQSGDSLFLIALERDTTVEAVMERNGLTDRSAIYTGQQLLVPRIGPGTR